MANYARLAAQEKGKVATMLLWQRERFLKRKGRSPRCCFGNANASLQRLLFLSLVVIFTPND